MYMYKTDTRMARLLLLCLLGVFAWVGIMVGPVVGDIVHSITDWSPSIAFVFTPLGWYFPDYPFWTLVGIAGALAVWVLGGKPTGKRVVEAWIANYHFLKGDKDWYHYVNVVAEYIMWAVYYCCIFLWWSFLMFLGFMLPYVTLLATHDRYAHLL